MEYPGVMIYWFWLITYFAFLEYELSFLYTTPGETLTFINAD